MTSNSLYHNLYHAACNLALCAFFCMFWLAAYSGIGAAYAQSPPATNTQGASNTQGVTAIEARQDDSNLLDAQAYQNLERTYKANMMLGRPDFVPSDYNSLFYTIWQHELLQDAKQLFRTRKPGEYERPISVDPAARERGPREVALGGILFTSADSWIVWLNGKRITPDAIPEEVMDINVNKEYVELKWLDRYNNLIFPIRIRPHQRFNLDARIFLPGHAVIR